MEETVEAAKAAFGIKDTPAPQASAKRELSTEVRGVGASMEGWQIQIPRAGLMQAKTGLVEENPGVIFAGEIRSTQDQALLGNAKDAFEVVIFDHSWHWSVYDTSNQQKAVFVRREKLGAETFDLPKTWAENGVPMSRKWVDRYICIDVKTPEALPYEVVMLGMSHLTAKNLNSKLFNLDMAGTSSLDIVVGLTTKLMEFQGNKNHGFLFSVLRKATPEEKGRATKWAQALASGKAKVQDDSDEIPF